MFSLWVSRSPRFPISALNLWASHSFAPFFCDLRLAISEYPSLRGPPGIPIFVPIFTGNVGVLVFVYLRELQLSRKTRCSICGCPILPFFQLSRETKCLFNLWVSRSSRSSPSICGCPDLRRRNVGVPNRIVDESNDYNEVRVMLESTCHYVSQLHESLVKRLAVFLLYG